MAITSGAYTGAYNSNSVGYTLEGFQWEVVGARKGVTTDTFGDTEVDGVVRGANCFCEMILQEWDAAGFAALWWPYDATPGVMEVHGYLEVASSLALPLVLTAVAGAPAATTGPASITFHKSILDAEFARRVNLQNSDRTMPVRMRNYITLQATKQRYFTLT